MFIVAPSCVGPMHVHPELILDSLGRFPIESGFIGGLQYSMWVVLSHSAVTEKSIMR